MLGLTTVLLLAASFLPAQEFSAPAMGKADLADGIAVRSFIEQFFAARYQSLVTNEVAHLDAYYALGYPGVEQQLAREKEYIREYYLQPNQASKLKITRQQSFVYFGNLKFEGSKAKAKAKVQVRVRYWWKKDGWTNEEMASDSEGTHDMEIVHLNGQWRLVRDRYKNFWGSH